MSSGSLQRRRGPWVEIYTDEQFKDERGDFVQAPTPKLIYRVRCAVIPNRSARAEVPGQVETNIVDCITTANLDQVSIWSRAKLNGTWWDLVTPPAMHYGPRNIRHWTFSLRERPYNGGIYDNG